MSDASKILWLSGDPGCGKSVLSAFIVDQVKESMPASTVCYFFCDDKVELQKTTLSILRSILHQLLSSRTALLSHVLPQFNVKAGAMFTEESLLWNILIKCLNDPTSGSVICIVDALDECDIRGQARFLKSLMKCSLQPDKSSNQSAMKILLTSRLEIQIADILAISTINLRIEDRLDNVNADIMLVVQEGISELVSLTQCSQATQEWLSQKLMKNADRTFL